MATCPSGHTSTATDYCDVCGAPMGHEAYTDPAVAAERLAAGEPTPLDTGGSLPGFAPGVQSPGALLICPNCHAANPPAALFCEACGYDFTTGSLPRLSTTAPAGFGGATAVRDLPVASVPPVASAPVVANPFDLDAVPVAATPVEAEPLDPPAPTASLGDDIVDADIIEDPAPAPVVPAPVDPAPVVPAPAVAAPVDPAPVVAAPVDPAPVVAAPVVPAPVEPASTLATPVPPPVGLPAPAQSAPASDMPVGKVEWVAEVWIDPDWYAGQESPDQLPSPGLPRVVGLRKRASLVGRPSKSRGIVPDVDCEPDTGASRRHAELTTDGKRWWVEDLGSSNGTYVGQAGSPLPTEPIRIRTELGEDARVYVGSWTRVVVRRANPDEVDL